mmetsp:Transcript_67565/g.188539  ORF Transcript_67565/g.188539 Transcript_67565/m.188539 type:complete len:368 (-) Transcript_67565:52-1155(-)
MEDRRPRLRRLRRCVAAPPDASLPQAAVATAAAAELVPQAAASSSQTLPGDGGCSGGVGEGDGEESGGRKIKKDWQAKVAALAAWIRTHGNKFPSRLGKSVDVEERRLAVFLGDQIRRAQAGRLEPEQLRLLQENVAGVAALLQGSTGSEATASKRPRRGVAATSQSTVDGVFATRTNELEAWILEHDGQLPWRRGKGTDRIETRLTNFLSEQRRALKRGTLPEARRLLLMRVPGMDERLRQWDDGGYASFTQRVDMLEAWVRSHGDTLPRQKSADPEEASFARFLNKLQKNKATLPRERRERLALVPGLELSLAKFLSWHQQAHRHGELAPERRRLLQAVPGMPARLVLWDRLLNDGADASASSGE